MILTLALRLTAFMKTWNNFGMSNVQYLQMVTELDRTLQGLVKTQPTCKT